MTSSYLSRACPSCGSKQSGKEVGSSPPAEELPMEKVAPYWSGLLKEKLFFSYNRCSECGLLYAPTYFNGAQIGELYASMAPNMDLVSEPSLEATQRGYWSEAQQAGLTRGSYLEIGPDVGYIVDCAAKEDLFDHFWLFEPNVAVHGELATAVAGQPHTISTVMDDLSEVPDQSVSLAVMVHVLDHILDPARSLERIHQKLRPDGLLLVVTHNERSLLRTVMGTRWPPFCLQHPELYNPSSIKRLIGNCGYSEARVKRSRNVFPLPFIVQQAAFVGGIRLNSVPLPNIPIGLKLGNIITLARR